MKMLIAAVLMALMLAACSTKTAATGGDDASGTDVWQDAQSCGLKDSHFAQLDDHCATIQGCAIFKATIPKCQPGAAKSCTCGECYGKQCVQQLCLDCADSAAAVDSASGTTEADAQPSDATTADLDVSVAETAPDAKLLPKQQASSFQACLCWKLGDDCSLPGGPTLPKDPSKQCPADEVCDGDFTHLYPNGSVAGQCHKLCALAGVDVAGTHDCAATEKCKATAIVSGFEGATILTVALCVPAQGAVGTNQSDAASDGK